MLSMFIIQKMDLWVGTQTGTQAAITFFYLIIQKRVVASLDI
jgi:hypothetical protein